MRYTPGPLQSPITREVAAHLRAIAARDETLRENVFMKVGDSISDHETWFMGCFAPDQGYDMLDLDGRDYLTPVIDHFSSIRIGDTTPLDRHSLSTKVGVSADWPLKPDDSGNRPLLLELEATQARYAVVMFGTNDLDFGGSEAMLRAAFWRMYTERMFALIDTLADRGVIPILTSVPFAESQPHKVQTLNAIVRGIAQARQIPFIDFYAALWPLARHGLGGDGVHPTTYYDPPGVPRACYLTKAGLEAGMNMRNLITIESLRRVHQVIGLGAEALDEAVEAPTGSPVPIGALPFVDYRNATEYRLTLAQATAVRVLALRAHGYETCRPLDVDCTGADDVTVSIDGTASANTEVSGPLTAGTHDIVTETTADEPLLLVVVQCEAGDESCE